jgi:hypothetical protein
VFEAEFVKYLTTLGVGGAIAGLCLAFYRKDMKLYTEQWKTMSELNMSVIRDSTAAITTNTEVLRAMQHSLEHIGCLDLDCAYRRSLDDPPLPTGVERRIVPRR